jgi:hypothetical protein
VGFICVRPRLNKFFFEVFIDRFVQSRRGRNGQDPVLCTSLPLIDIWATHIGEGVGDFLPWIHHDRVCSVHKLIESKFVEKMIGLLSISFEDGGFFPLERSFIYSNLVQVLWELWWGSRWWCWRRRSSEGLLRGFRIRGCRSESILCRKGPRKCATN